uniref:Mitochondrial peptide methionine sulfoxide reductase-like n=1 Tax=Sinocyclocheilus anshuiensis TaxID=1608454 RepID=A0A671PR21_9TELE
MVARTSVRLVWRYFVQNRMGDMSSKIRMPSPEEALLGREQSMKVSAKHDVNGNRTVPPFPEGLQMVLFGLKLCNSSWQTGIKWLFYHRALYTNKIIFNVCMRLCKSQPPR